MWVQQDWPACKCRIILGTASKDRYSIACYRLPWLLLGLQLVEEVCSCWTKLLPARPVYCGLKKCMPLAIETLCIEGCKL